MGILKRFSDIMSANINSAMEKHEDPAIMIDQYIRNLNSDLGKVKAETAAVMAEAANASRKVESCKQKVENAGKYAKEAVNKGNDDDARIFIMEKQSYESQLEDLIQARDVAYENEKKMREMHDKLSLDIETVTAKRDMLHSKLAVAKTQEKVASVENGMSLASNNLAGIERMESKITKKLDEAEALSKLKKTVSKSDDLKEKYDIQANNEKVELELQELKESLVSV